MRFGIVTYQITYSSEMNKVCISTTDVQPASIRFYSRDELTELIASEHNGLKEIYEKALSYFPAAHAASQS